MIRENQISKREFDLVFGIFNLKFCEWDLLFGIYEHKYCEYTTKTKNAPTQVYDVGGYW